MEGRCLLIIHSLPSRVAVNKGCGVVQEKQARGPPCLLTWAQGRDAR
jgi:hypothetical protein